MFCSASEGIITSCIISDQFDAAKMNVLHITFAILPIVTMDLVYAFVLKLCSQIPLREPVLYLFFLFIFQAIGEGTEEVNGTTFLAHRPPPKKTKYCIVRCAAIVV